MKRWNWLNSGLLTLLILMTPITAVQAEDPPTAAPSPETEGSAGDTGDASAEQPSPDIPDQPRVEPDPEALQLADLVNATQPETEVRWLTTEHDASILLYHPQNRPEARGGIVFIHNEGSHADWANHIRPLRLHLSDHGWHTLSLQMPRPPAAEIPKRTLPVIQKVQLPSETPTEGEPAPQAPQADAAEPQQNADTETPEATPTPEANATEPTAPTVPYAQRIQLLTDAALTELKGLGSERIILLGVGSGAIWAADTAVRIQDTEQELGLLLLDATQPSDPSAPALLTLMDKLKIPVVDAYQSLPDTQLPFEAEAKQRMRRAQRAGLAHYYQRRLTNHGVSWQGKEPWLTRQITGLVRQHLDKPIEAAKLEREAKSAGGASKPKERAPGR